MKIKNQLKNLTKKQKEKLKLKKIGDDIQQIINYFLVLIFCNFWETKKKLYREI